MCSQKRGQPPEGIPALLCGLHDSVLTLQPLIAIPFLLLGRAGSVPENLGQVFDSFDVVHDKRRLNIRDATEGFYKVGQILDLCRVARGTEQGELVGEYEL